jgi:hypothetical protein
VGALYVKMLRVVNKLETEYPQIAIKTNAMISRWLHGYLLPYNPKFSGLVRPLLIDEPNCQLVSMEIELLWRADRHFSDFMEKDVQFPFPVACGFRITRFPYIRIKRQIGL